MATMLPPKEADELLMREAAMSSMSLGIGLTHLRRYNFSAVGFFYHGILSITTGLERLLKLVLIYDYRLTYPGAFPTNDMLKSFGHKIGDLFSKTKAINTARGLGVSTTFIDSDVVFSSIITFLSDFAQVARYYNLDTISGKKQHTVEPLTRWDREIGAEMVKRHYHRAASQDGIEAMAAIIESSASVIHSDEQGKPIGDVRSFVDAIATVDTKQKFSMYYTYLLIRFAADVLRECETRGKFSPYLSEFFSIFRYRERRYILKKRSWNPVPPYQF